MIKLTYTFIYKREGVSKDSKSLYLSIWSPNGLKVSKVNPKSDAKNRIHEGYRETIGRLQNQNVIKVKISQG